MLNHDLIEREKIIEGERMIGGGRDRFTNNLNKNIKNGRLSVTPAFIYLQKQLLLPLAEAIDKFLEESYSSERAGVRKASAEPLKDIGNSKEIALSTLRCVIDCIASNKTLAQTAVSLGTIIEYEHKIKIFKKDAPDVHFKIARDLSRRTKNARHIRRVFSHSIDKYKIKVDNWETSKKVLVGKQLIDLLIQSTGLCEVVCITKARNKTVNILQLKQEILKKIDEKNFQCSVLTPYYLPMIVTPKVWKDSPYNGGYYNEYLSKQPLIKTNDKKYLDELEREGRKDFYEAVNHLQSVPFVIDKNMFDVFSIIWKEGLQLGHFTSRDSLLDETGRPKDVIRNPLVETDKELLIKYKRDCTNVYQAEIARVSKVLQTSLAITIIEEYLNEKGFYFVLFMDTRGRIYTVGGYLSYQADQKIRSVIAFKNGERIGDRGKYWLYVHAANTYGNDKISFDERVKFTEDNLDEFLSYADNPFENMGWDKADKPMEFLQTCFHLKNVKKQGLDYVCNLPVSMDATCSGLQILSILSRDYETGWKVNVTPSDKPNDIYSIICDSVTGEVKKLAGEGSLEANRWLQFGINRNLVKRNIMTYVYGLKPFGAREQVFDEYKKQVDLGKPKILKDDGFSDCRWLADINWRHIQTQVPKASELMVWFQYVAKLFSQANIPMKWVTPVGFKAVQDYKYLREYKVKTAISGQLVYTTLRKEMLRSDVRRMQSSSAPNITHSLDAALATAVAVYCKHNSDPIPNVFMVHDSFATTPNKVDLLHTFIRKAVIDLFEKDYLDNLFNQFYVQLPDRQKKLLTPPPSRGKLNILDVLSSKYFFM
jgi:DNA-directed RNA polymerase